MKFNSLLFLSLFMVVVSAGCKKMRDLDGDFDVPGVAITFDDNAVRCWYKNLNFLDSLGIKATFYVSAYHTLSANEKQLLKRIRARGHEIEYHTTNHSDLASLLYKKGWDEVYRTEIKPDLEQMRADGFAIKHFAYPFGRHCEQLDNKLLGMFRSVRALDGTKRNSNCYAVSKNSAVLYSMGIDESSGVQWPALEERLRKAITDRKCLVLLGHEIDNHGYRYSTKKDLLRQVAGFVQANNMRFYLVNDIARK